MSITALAIINRALDDIGVRSQGETLSNADAQESLNRLNAMVQSWSIQSLAIPYTDREVFSAPDIVALQSTYTIGDGGDLDTDRPSTIVGAGLLLNASTPPVEIPRTLLTDDEYQAIQIKDLQSVLFTAVYYNPTYPFGTIFLWPTPTTAQNSLVLYRPKQLSEFSDLSNDYDVPPGYEEALEWNLAEALLAGFAVKEPSIIQRVDKKAVQTLATIKRTNMRPSDLHNYFVIDRRSRYNILTGTGGR